MDKYYQFHFSKTYNLICEIYDLYPTGGALHKVLDEGYISDENIKRCLREIKETPNLYPNEHVELYKKCILYLLKLPMQDRCRCVCKAIKHYKAIQVYEYENSRLSRERDSIV